VTKVWVNHDADLMDFTVRSGGKTSVIRATQHHLFWDALRKAWTEAQNLRPGDRLHTDNSAVATVAAAAVVGGAADMWSLTVAATHDFYIITPVANVLVHNCPTSSGAMTTPEASKAASDLGYTTKVRGAFSYGQAV
jgi:hypothetical protein